MYCVAPVGHMIVELAPSERVSLTCPGNVDSNDTSKMFLNTAQHAGYLAMTRPVTCMFTVISLTKSLT